MSDLSIQNPVSSARIRSDSLVDKFDFSLTPKASEDKAPPSGSASEGSLVAKADGKGGKASDAPRETSSSFATAASRPTEPKTEQSSLFAADEAPLVARAANPPYSTLLRLIEPDATAFGITTAVGPGAPHGQFVLRTASGAYASFSSKTVKPLPPVPTPHGEIKHGFSVVGTIGQTADGGITDQSGAGYAAKIPTPMGDMLLFANLRQDWATIGNIFQDRERHVVNVTLGFGYSVSDGAAQVLAAKFPKAGVPLQAGLNASGTDAWMAAAYAGQLVIENGAPTAIIISGVEVPLDQIAALFGDEIESGAMSGAFLPEALNNSPLRDFDPVNTNVTELGSRQRKIIERAFDRGLTTPAEQHRAMREAIADPAAAFPDLPPDGRRVAVAILNALLDRMAEADALLETVYRRDNPDDGIRPRGFGGLAQPELARLEAGRVSGERVSHGFVGVPGAGQAEIRYDAAQGLFSLHGRNNAQHPLSGASNLEEAMVQARILIAGGGFSSANLFPLQGHDGTRIGSMPQQPTRVGQGFAGVPGIGQLEIRWNPNNGAYSAHGPNNAQYPLPGVASLEEARERTRELIRNGAVSRENLLPL
jgi:hypothetical protein